jgi:hypothetical protein
MLAEELAALGKLSALGRKKRNFGRALMLQPIAMFSLLTFASHAIHPIEAFAAVMMVVSLALGLPFGILIARDGKRVSSLASVARDSGKVEVYAQEGSSELIREPQSSLILSALPRNVLTALPVEVAELPETNEYAEMLPWTPIEAIIEGERPPVRDLSPAEKEELKELVNRLTLRALSWRVVILVYFGFRFIDAAFYLHHMGQTIVYGAFVAYDCYLLYGWARQDQALKRDLAHGQVVRFAEGENHLEVLPLSKVIWTANQTPGTARTAGHVRKY